MTRTPVDGDADGLGLRRWRSWVIGLYAGMVVAAAGGVLVAFVLDHPKPGHHRHVTTLLLALAVMVLLLSAVFAICWRLMGNHGPTRRVMRSDWRTRRRVGNALRRGQPIPVEDRMAAVAIVDFYRGRRWVGWLWPALAVVWLVNTVLAHGVIRWLDATLAVAYTGFLFCWLRLRGRVLDREAELR